MTTYASSCKRILIADNDEDVLIAFEKLFEAAGFAAHATWSGHEALSLIKSGKFSALLIGTYLADIHSAEFLGRMSRLPTKPPVVVVMQDRVPTRADQHLYESLGVSAVVDKGDAQHVREVVALCSTANGIFKVH